MRTSINNDQASYTEQRESHITHDLGAFKKIIKKKDWEDAKNNTAFQRFVKVRYEKNVEELDYDTMGLFWDDVSKYLDEVEEVEKRCLQIQAQGIGMELQNLWSEVEKARSDFNYAGVSRLLEAFGEKHENVSQNLDALAVRYVSQGLYKEAEIIYKQVLALMEKALGPDHLNVATSLNNLATLYISQGRYREAEPLYLRVLSLGESTWPGSSRCSYKPEQPREDVLQSRAVQTGGAALQPVVEHSGESAQPGSSGLENSYR